MRPTLLLALASMMVGLSTREAGAVIVDSQSNYVPNGTITVAPGDNDRSDWISIPSFLADPSGDASDIDYTGLQIAHDDVNVYLHLTFAAQSSPQFLGFMHNLFFDTDLDRSTGYFGVGGFLSIGADFLLQGSSQFQFAGATQESFSWSFLGSSSFDDFPTSDIEISVPRATLGNPDAFDIVLNAATTPLEDYYPDAASGGLAGTAFRYSLVAVPEPSPFLALLLISGVIANHSGLCRSRRTSS